MNVPPGSESLGDWFSRGARVPVFTYHSMHVSGNSYEMNDHVALSSDLELVTRRGFRICPLSVVVDALESDRLRDLANCAAITFDDGSDFDFRDLPHPTWGEQRSMLGILREAAVRGSQPTLEATSFTIVSPDAREELDRKVMVGRSWWRDDWWSAAEATGLLRVESHGWDHNHECLEKTVSSAPRGTFELTSILDADAEIRASNDYLCTRRGRHGPVLFAYPYGPANDFLAKEYFPRGTRVHGVRAAFTTDGAPVSRGANRWRLPRFVFGWHWKSTAELERILNMCT